LTGVLLGHRLGNADGWKQDEKFAPQLRKFNQGGALKILRRAVFNLDTADNSTQQVKTSKFGYVIEKG